MTQKFDVIVVGGGHAGVEAAYAAAKMGATTALVSLDTDKIATMPCNPSLGGLGKGHIVFEVSALGGLMPKLASKTYLQARMLNTRKGPAVQGLRLQIDKYAYSKLASETLKQTPNLTLIPLMAVKLLSQEHDDQAQPKRIVGIECHDGTQLFAPSVVITAGTFLNGVVHIGRTRYKAGRRGEEAVYGLSESLAELMGVTLGRLKTGTPPRLLKQTLDYSKFEQQACEKLEYLFEFEHFPVQEKVPCYVAYTNPETHDVIANNLHLSAMYSGNIKGVGPRYCPSIEDKIGRFKDRTAHHVFIEPEAEFDDEIYPAGISTSLPLDVQYQYIRSIKGMENAVISKCGYAIEYDCVQPTNLHHTLEAKTVKGLFLAGQINGTTGYEEAAGQGILAGINAVLSTRGEAPFILSRHESYIGLMIDDLVTLGADEPYRMFTSRAERRLLLRQDNVFLRIMPYGRKLGLIDDTLWKQFEAERDTIDFCVSHVKQTGNQSKIFKLLHSIDFTDEIASEAREILCALLINAGKSTAALSARALLCIHAHIKYDGYLAKEEAEVEKMNRYQQLQLPENFEYKNLSGLSKELQTKLTSIRPKTIAQAQMIPGMTPAAISLLIFQTRLNASAQTESSSTV